MDFAQEPGPDGKNMKGIRFWEADMGSALTSAFWKRTEATGCTSAGEPEKASADEEDNDDTDSLLDEAIDLVVETGQASTSFIQRRFKVGYARAGRIIDQMEQRGIISGYQGSKPREVLMSKEIWQELKMAPTDTRENSVENDTLEVEINLPNKGLIKGMGIKKGITLIVGGGYHGKSTLLNALELGEKSSLNIDFSFSDIVEAYKNKDDLTVREVNKNIEYFSIGIVNLVNMVNPDVIIIGDEMVNFGDDFLNILKSNVSKKIIPDLYNNLDIRLGNFAEDEVLIGASIVAVESILKTGSLIRK